jgi:hypothetical protein
MSDNGTQVKIRQYLFADNEINPGSEFKEPKKDSNIFIHTIFPVGHFHNKKYGDVWMTTEKIEEMVENFGKHPDYQVPVKLGHGDGAPSPGTVIGLRSTERGLEATFSVNAEASEAIRRKLYRYTSGELDSEYLDPKTGDKVGHVLLGLALVNQPGVPYMEPLQFVDAGVSSEEQPPDNGNTGTKIEKEDKSMSEEKNGATTEPKVKEEEKNGEKTVDFLAEKARLEAELKAAHLEREKLAAEKTEHEAKIAELTAAQEAAKLETATAKVASFSDIALKKISPQQLEVLKPLIKPERVMAFADTAEDSPLKILTKFIEGLPEAKMTQQMGFSDVTGNEANRAGMTTEAERAKRMAEHANRNAAEKSK